jgi:hypothetical protein
MSVLIRVILPYLDVWYSLVARTLPSIGPAASVFSAPYVPCFTKQTGMTFFVLEYVIRWQCPQNGAANLRMFYYIVQHVVTNWDNQTVTLVIKHRSVNSEIVSSKELLTLPVSVLN